MVNVKPTGTYKIGFCRLGNNEIRVLPGERRLTKMLPIWHFLQEKNDQLKELVIEAS
jgi:hypothetical protein